MELQLGRQLWTQLWTQENHPSSSTSTHPDQEGELHGARDTFGHREVAIVCVDDECAIRVSWKNLGWSLVSGPSVVSSRCRGAKPSLTCYNAVDDRLVNGLISIHSIDGTRTQDEGGRL